MKTEKYIPPRLAVKFLSWFLREDICEEVKGDLQEKFYTVLKPVEKESEKLSE